MPFSPDRKYTYYDMRTNVPIDVVYRHRDPDCEHNLGVFARLRTTDGRWQIYQCCVECGEYSAGPLPYAEHEDFMSYPCIDDRFTRHVNAARQVRVRYREQNIFAVGDSGGYEICNRDLYHKGDAFDGTRALYRWNERIDSISHRDIATGRRKLLQYALHHISLSDGELDAWMATDIDLTRYEDHIQRAFNAIGFEVHRVTIGGLDKHCADDLTRFDDEPKYSDYLASTQWRNNRERAMRSAPNLVSMRTGTPSCENPYCRSMSRKVDCHHLTYRNVGHEQPGELIFLCRECHSIAEFFKAHTEYATQEI